MASPKSKRKASKRLSPSARREAVEAAIRERGWDHDLALELAKDTGWSWRTIYRDREAVIERLVAEEQEDLPRRRASFLADLRALRAAAKKGGAYSPAAKLMAMEGQILGLDRAPLPTVEEGAGPLDTSLEGVLAETWRLYRRAVAGHSYVAAEKLLEQIHDLTRAIQAREEEAQRRRQEHLDEDGLVSLIEATAARLPAPLLARLRVALGAGADGR